MQLFRNLTRTRALREGSVGLLILIALFILGSFIFWLRGFKFGRDSYTVIIEFEHTNGMIVGGTVRYRGFKVGNIVGITPQSNRVDVEVEIAPVNLLIPKAVKIEANQAGLISETSIDITPLRTLPQDTKIAQPLSRRCNRDLIVCNQDRLRGLSGVTLEDALRSVIDLSSSFANPRFFNRISELAGNASKAADQVSQLSGELTKLSQSVRGEVRSLSQTAKEATNIATGTVQEYRTTAAKLNQLADNVNGIVGENRTNLRLTLQNISGASRELQTLVGTFNRTAITFNSTVSSANRAMEGVDRTVAGFNQTVTTVNQTVGNLNNTVTKASAAIPDPAQVQQLMQNLTLLSNNAAAASENLRDISKSFNDPTTIVELQRILHSARATFENVQKITSDLDDLTGNPEFRNNILKLVDGLSNLVSSTEQLEEQVQTAEALGATQAKLEQLAQIVESTPEVPPAIPESPLPTPNSSTTLTESPQPPTPVRTLQESLLLPPTPQTLLPQTDEAPILKSREQEKAKD